MKLQVLSADHEQQAYFIAKQLAKEARTAAHELGHVLTSFTVPPSNPLLKRAKCRLCGAHVFIQPSINTISGGVIFQVCPKHKF